MNISLIEFLVYAVIAYSSLLVLVFSVTKDVPLKSKKMTLVRSMYMIPGIICFIILAGSGVFIYLGDSTVTTTATSVYEVLDNTNTVVVLNSTVSQTESTSNVFELQNPIWVTLHYLFALILFVFVFIQVLTMLTAKE